MEEQMHKQPEAQMEELVELLELLSINRTYLDELENRLKAEGQSERLNQSSLYQHRRDISLSIYQLLLTLHPEDPLFQSKVRELEHA